MKKINNIKQQNMNEAIVRELNTLQALRSAYSNCKRTFEEDILVSIDNRVREILEELYSN